MAETTVPYTLEQLTTLQAALASGLTEVTYNGRTFRYNSISDLKKAIDVVKQGLNAQSGIITIRQRRVVTYKGFDWPSAC
jgi:hypothetical protein